MGTCQTVTHITLDIKSPRLKPDQRSALKGSERGREMTEAATAPKTTTPRRSRAASTTKTAAPAAKTPAKETPAPAAPAVTDNRIKIELDHHSDTKNYARFVVPEELKGVVVGSIYAPLGTSRVLVAVIGAGDDGADA